MGELSRQEALTVLGLPAGADSTAVKRAYRRLARHHHPDLGGDAASFHRLQHAFERLVDEPVPATLGVPGGRPSRPFATTTTNGGHADLDSIDWSVTPPISEVALDRDRLAVLLASVRTDRPGGTPQATGQARPVRPVTAASRAPGSRLNRLARVLASELTSTLAVAPARDDRGRVVVTIELRAANRRARRALDRASLGGTWTRTRRPTSTLLTCALMPSHDPRATAVHATDRLEDLLTTLDWPLSAWTLTNTNGQG